MFDKMIRFDYAYDLHEHLKGLNMEGDDYTGTSLYNIVFITLASLVLVIMINYYYGIFNRPKLSSFWTWLINILGTSAIVFGIATSMPMNDLHSGNYYQKLSFTGGDCMLFGATAATYTLLFCVALSLIIKWWSLNNKKIPF